MLAFLTDLKNFFNDVLISGTDFISLSFIEKLKFFSTKAERYNLTTLKKLLEDFISGNDEREKLFVDIMIWLEIAIFKAETIEEVK